MPLEEILEVTGIHDDPSPEPDRDEFPALDEFVDVRHAAKQVVLCHFWNGECFGESFCSVPGHRSLFFPLVVLIFTIDIKGYEQLEIRIRCFAA
jgi:hypothetical protein